MAKVAVGLSGGVDSSVAAWLLKKQGHEVIGVTMQTRREQAESSGDGVLRDAEAVAVSLGIPLYVADCCSEFRRDVIGYFIREYEAGRTPNPCIVCNRLVKWESLLSKAEELGADYIATGHYASVVTLPNGRRTLHTAAGDESTSKDQTYALYRLTQEQLSKTLMPLGGFTKPEIRRMAEAAGIPVANKPDSEEICFVPDKDYAGFIERTTGAASKPGSFVDEEGRVLGTHRGIIHYTIGQRKHLGIALGHPAFVGEIRRETNEVVLCGNDALFKNELIIHDLNWMSESGISEPLHVMAKIRYNHKAAPAVIEACGEDTVRCVFEEPQRAVTPGQAAVFYRDGLLLGGGTIE